MDSLKEVSAAVREKRKRLRISQKRLARFIKMSQSTIARVENDIERLNPSYDTIFRISTMLNDLEKIDIKNDMLRKTAGSIMQKKIIYAKATNTVAEAIRIIKNYDFPRLPVLNKDMNVMGAISQKRVMGIATNEPENLDKIHVSDIIDSGLPQVGPEAEFSKIRKILEEWDAVLVVERGKAVGIITIYDVLKRI